MNYQFDYAANRPHMYDSKSRKRKAIRIVKSLEKILGKDKLNSLTLLDVGSSTGIIDNKLASSFKKVVGTDIDEQAVQYARSNFKKSNLIFKVENAMNLSFKENTFDIVICAQVYEHVPSPKKLFSEIYRVLKPGGVCYLAALNKLWPVEPHYNLLFLSWLPKPLANLYIKITGKGQEYYETPESYWKLKKLTQNFHQNDLTDKILRNPMQYGFDDAIHPGSLTGVIAFLLSPLAKYLAPTFFWILKKPV